MHLTGERSKGRKRITITSIKPDTERLLKQKQRKMSRLKTDIIKITELICEPVCNSKMGRVTAQVVSRRPLTAEARIRGWVNPCGIYGGQSCTGTGFSPSSSVFPSYHSTVALQTHIIWGMRNMLT
jgi:hypothetical protein